MYENILDLYKKVFVCFSKITNNENIIISTATIVIENKINSIIYYP